MANAHVDLYNRAMEAGRAAAAAADVTLVRASGFDEVFPIYGHAWVRFPGNTAFARALKKAGLSDTHYGGGHSIFVCEPEYGDSYDLRGAHAHAMARYLRDNGVDGAWATVMLN